MCGFTFDYLVVPYDFEFRKDNLIVFADNEKEFLNLLNIEGLLDDYYKSIGYTFNDNLFD